MTIDEKTSKKARIEALIQYRDKLNRHEHLAEFELETMLWLIANLLLDEIKGKPK